MFKKLLIANRGEIACRVIETARRMGIRTVAIYSDVDKNSRHVRLADEAFGLGGKTSSESYLDIEKVIDCALKSGSQAIHPGYGFLSENADFARACRDNDIKFVGPSEDSILAMGLKDKAKDVMDQAGVPVVPLLVAAVKACD
jgi:3-methylcrotonyl-CoA carboxylase alpha subunit